MGQVCTKDNTEQQADNTQPAAPAEGGMRPAVAPTPAEQPPQNPADAPPQRQTTDFANLPQQTSQFGQGSGEWTTADQAPPLNAKVQEALKRAKPRSWTNYPDLKEFGSYMTKKLRNAANNEFYEGHNLRDQPYGWGTLIGANGDLLEGVFIEGKPARYIRHIDTNGTIYEGDFLLGRNGKGTLIEANGRVVKCDRWVNGFPQGEITEEDQFGRVVFRGTKDAKGFQGKCFVAQTGFNLEATYKDNVVQGPVTKFYPDGSRYDGAVDANLVEEGLGALTFSDGRKFAGPFVKGKANGPGKFTTDTGKVVDQTWKDGKRA